MNADDRLFFYYQITNGGKKIPNFILLSAWKMGRNGQFQGELGRNFENPDLSYNISVFL